MPFVEPSKVISVYSEYNLKIRVLFFPVLSLQFKCFISQQCESESHMPVSTKERKPEGCRRHEMNGGLLTQNTYPPN